MEWVYIYCGKQRQEKVYKLSTRLQRIKKPHELKRITIYTGCYTSTT